MAFKLGNRAVQTSTTVGTGTLDLIAPATGVKSFVAQVGNGNPTGYLIEDPGTGDWELTIGTVASGTPDTITRAATPIDSSNAGARVAFGAGTKTVACVPIMDLLPYFAAVPTYADDQVLQRKSGAWVVRTIAQLLADLMAGGQLQFPATQNPSSDVNCLDDYEEGSCTITDRSGASLSITNTFAKYTKIGNQVTVVFRGNYPATGSGAAAGLAGLPFTVASNGFSPGAVNTDSSIGLIARAEGGSTNIALRGTSNADPLNSDLSARLVGFTITYFV
jgi:hypothetical protein